ncbi:hypothetical protein HORM4_1180037 [Vibrio harveyi]|nr:hypothetical protein HORM4_1180037 [Vibrio harveyi]
MISNHSISSVSVNVLSTQLNPMTPCSAMSNEEESEFPYNSISPTNSPNSQT